MKILQLLFEDEVQDLRAQYLKLKVEHQKLVDNRPVMSKFRPNDDQEYQIYLRKKALFDKTMKIWHQRWQELTQKLQRQKGELAHSKYKHLPTGIFVTYDTVAGVESPEFIDEIGQLIHYQNETLGDPAAYAIDRFVGHTHGIHSDGAGAWSEHKLEDAYSAQPSPDGVTIRQQLEAGMKPIRSAIQTRFGDIIYLYRSQRPLNPGSTSRNVLSWTASEKFANYHGGDQFTKIVKQIPLSDVVWITDRARQQEFICLNHIGSPNYIGS